MTERSKRSPHEELVAALEFLAEMNHEYQQVVIEKILSGQINPYERFVEGKLVKNLKGKYVTRQNLEPRFFGRIERVFRGRTTSLQEVKADWLNSIPPDLIQQETRGLGEKGMQAIRELLNELASEDVQQSSQ